MGQHHALQEGIGLVCKHMTTKYLTYHVMQGPLNTYHLLELLEIIFRLHTANGEKFININMRFCSTLPFAILLVSFSDYYFSARSSDLFALYFPSWPRKSIVQFVCFGLFWKKCSPNYAVVQTSALLCHKQGRKPLIGMTAYDHGDIYKLFYLRPCFRCPSLFVIFFSKCHIQSTLHWKSCFPANKHDTFFYSWKARWPQLVPLTLV